MSRGGEIDLAQPFGDVSEPRRIQAGPNENSAKWIHIASCRDTAEQRRFDQRSSAAHEWIVNNVPRFRQPLDEEARQRGFKTGAIRDFMQRMRGALLRRPEFVDVRGNSDRLTVKCPRPRFADSRALGLEVVEERPRATDQENLDSMAQLVRTLEKNGHTYESDGSVYFKISTLPQYGRLARLDHDGLKAGARVDSDNYDKDNARDFVLWKATKENEPSWDFGIRHGDAAGPAGTSNARQ